MGDNLDGKCPTATPLPRVVIDIYGRSERFSAYAREEPPCHHRVTGRITDAHETEGDDGLSCQSNPRRFPQ